MIPFMTIRQRIIAWLLWRFERFDSEAVARFAILERPDFLRSTALLREYWYVKKAKEWTDD